MSSEYHVFQSAAGATGNGTALKVRGAASVTVDLAISASATVTFEGTGQDGTFKSVLCQNLTTGALASTATATGLYLFPLTGLVQARVRISTFGSGTITAKGYVSPLPFAFVPSPAAALADDTVNPVAPLSGALAHGFDGTTWDRLRTAKTDATTHTAGVLAVAPYFFNSSTFRPLAAAADLTDALSGDYLPGYQPYLYNGATHDRARNNTSGTLLASAARTATASSADQVNYDARGVHIYINVTAVTDTPCVVFTAEDKDPVSGAYATLLTSAAITGTGLTRLTVYPGATPVANVAVSLPLPRTWRLTATHGDADSITFSAGYALIK